MTNDGFYDHAFNNVPSEAARSASFFISSTKVDGNNSICSNCKANGDCHNQVLNWINKRECSHGIVAYFCDKDAVNNIIQRIDEHRQRHRQCHRNYKRQHWFLLHVSLIHKKELLSDFKASH